MNGAVLAGLLVCLTVAGGAQGGWSAPLRDLHAGDRAGRLTVGLVPARASDYYVCPPDVVYQTPYFVVGRDRTSDALASVILFTVSGEVRGAVTFDEADLATLVAIYAIHNGQVLAKYIPDDAPPLCTLVGP